jgi:hypothetical protein
MVSPNPAIGRIQDIGRTTPAQGSGAPSEAESTDLSDLAFIQRFRENHPVWHRSRGLHSGKGQIIEVNYGRTGRGRGRGGPGIESGRDRYFPSGVRGLQGQVIDQIDPSIADMLRSIGEGQAGLNREQEDQYRWQSDVW